MVNLDNNNLIELQAPTEAGSALATDDLSDDPRSNFVPENSHQQEISSSFLSGSWRDTGIPLSNVDRTSRHNDASVSSGSTQDVLTILFPKPFPSDNLVSTSAFPRSSSIFQDSVLLLDSYSGVLSRVLSIYDGRFSPFRAAALSEWRRSPLLYSAFKYFVGIYRSGGDANCRHWLGVNEARLVVLGGLSSSLLTISRSLPVRKTEVLFVVCMFGLSSSWYDWKDLGLEHYYGASALLSELLIENPKIPPKTTQFFAEFLLYWWMMLSFACDPELRQIQDPPPIPQHMPEPRMPHPLTGISPESQLLLGKVGRLVLSQRRTALRQAMTTAGALNYGLAGIEESRNLEHQLVSLKIPTADMILDPQDPHTSVNDLVNIARAYQLCGLLLLYCTYPNLLDHKLPPETSHAARTLVSETPRSIAEYLISLAIHVLRVLEQNSKNSGTRTIEAILLMIVSGVLSQRAVCPSGSEGEIQCDICYQLPGISLSHEHSSLHGQMTATEARALVVTRFQRIQDILPFNTIWRMKLLVLETWRLMDQGSDVFWVDLLVQNNWQFVMI
ncbi:hypothetical protein Z517_08972 [Fonsecaea pedrosoi CBS 271.37]|uniref:Transcription factor domain-containing protein n=1 Tax=Fonsecaea pedrosoi CBS 271.37 TaxID=1442368 RepID=A0A0D2EY78_9EURO|nr:uncharacterized protein Z517_08972 [Fonsecaea pedrosoi CBS 271.37]KIW79132.1 hypothetical protein Z517_08972 [Fonsecaea pedrosoi CBS 271.37]